MTAKEVGKIMGVSGATVRIWIREKKLKAKITPKGWVITQEQLENYIDKYKKVSE